MRDFSYAKLNLFLHVIGKRPDSFHFIQSVFLKTPLFDEVIIEKNDFLACKMHPDFVGTDNIVMKAAIKLSSIKNINKGARIIINKNIPIGSGLGGGSANCATAIRMLIKFWNIEISEKEVFELGLSLGSDVPFCLSGSHAFVTGVGEKILPIHLPSPIYMVLVNPGINVSTKEVFSHLKTFSKPMEKEITPQNFNINEFIFNARNDLEDPAYRLFPALKTLKDTIKNQYGCMVSRMSGSGSTHFGIFDTLENAISAADSIKNQNNQWFVKTISIPQ